MTTKQNSDTGHNLFTGVPGLDQLLNGGLTRDRLYLVEGAPGSGKTTLALQFLIEGARHGEPVLYITLSETAVELRAVAAAHGWNLENVHIHEVLPSEKVLEPDEHYTIFHPGDVESGTTTRGILEAVKRYQPARVVLDSLSELQLLATNSLVYRRQVLAFKQFFATRACTALFLDDNSGKGTDMEVRSIAHGVINLSRMATDYGGIRRRLEVIKYRGIAFREGLHDYKIVRGGLVVFTRLIASHSRLRSSVTRASTGIEQLDMLLGGGIEHGSSTLLAGPPGTGKSSVATEIVQSFLLSGHRAAMFVFEESVSNFINRSQGMGIDLEPALAAGTLLLNQIDPAQLTPGEFVHLVCQAADDGAKIVVIDSLKGFMQAMPNEKMLTTHLHELLSYLGQKDIVTLLVGVQQGMFGGDITTSADASYLADNVVMLRYFEADGAVHKAISVFKKRGGPHESTIRLFSLSSHGVRIGAVLSNFRGILSGLPQIVERAANVP